MAGEWRPQAGDVRHDRPHGGRARHDQQQPHHQVPPHPQPDPPRLHPQCHRHLHPDHHPRRGQVRRQEQGGDLLHPGAVDPGSDVRGSFKFCHGP